MKKISPPYSGASDMDVMVLGSTFTSCSIASCFDVYIVASFNDRISDPLINSFNERSIISLNFWLL